MALSDFLSRYLLPSLGSLGSESVFYAIFALTVVILLTLRLHTGSTAPGPYGLPFFGVAFQIPSDKQWLKFHEWTVRYGAYLSILYRAVHGSGSIHMHIVG